MTTKLASAIGLVVALATAAILSIMSAGPGAVEARASDAPAPCHSVDTAVDEGYGVTRYESKRVCGRL